MVEPLVSSVDHELVEQIKFVAYSVVAYVIVAIGMLGNVLSLVVLTRPMPAFAPSRLAPAPRLQPSLPQDPAFIMS